MKKPDWGPKFWQRIKAFCRRHKVRLLAGGVIFFTITSFFTIVAPGIVPVLLDWLVDLIFWLMFKVSDLFAYWLHCLDGRTYNIPHNERSRRFIKWYTTWIIEELPDFADCLVGGQLLIHFSADLLLLLSYPRNSMAWHLFFLEYGHLFKDRIPNSWYTWTNLPQATTGYHNELLRFFLTISIPQSHLSEMVEVGEVPWAQVTVSTFSWFAQTDLVTRPERSFLSFWLYFSIFFERLAFEPEFLSNPGSYQFIFREDPYTTFRFLIFIHSSSPEVSDFDFFFDVNGMLEIRPHESPQTKVLYSPRFLRQIELDANWGTIKKP